ncbi:unnamed protein product, partial [Ectocarpus sp. 8 AP-2014]
TAVSAQGWEIRVDQASGERYFVNHNNRTTTWNGEWLVDVPWYRRHCKHR